MNIKIMVFLDVTLYSLRDR